MVMCCALSEADERADVYNVTHRRARKQHACEECREPIAVGTLHEHVSMFFDRVWSSYRMCFLCSEIGDHFSCGQGRLVGLLWEDLENNFFPDMRMGGPCMEGLSPAAKAKLVERRMAWYLDQDEIDDSDWEDWPKHRDRQRPIRVPIEREEQPSSYQAYYDSPEYYWKRELELDAYRDKDDGDDPVRFVVELHARTTR